MEQFRRSLQWAASRPLLLVEISECETSEQELLSLALLASDGLRTLPGQRLSSAVRAVLSIVCSLLPLNVAPPTGRGHDRHPSVDCTFVCNLTVRACRCSCEKLTSCIAAGNTIIASCPPTSSFCRWKLEHASPGLHGQRCSDSTSSSTTRT